MNDSISRQSAIDEANAWLLDCLKVNKQDRSCGLIRRLEDLPSAEPERKKGKWIEYEQEFMLEGHTETVQKTVRECSVCTAKIAGMVGIMNFCPNCGAKMEVTT